jgi:two-component system, LuxR family, response regulator FixJ
MIQAGMVYIVDDDIAIRSLVEALVRAAGMETQSFASAQDFGAAALADRPSCLLLDLEMPGVSGLEFLETHFKNALPCSVIILTGHGSIDSAVRSMKSGAVDFLEKPFNHKELVRRVEAAIARDRIRRTQSESVADVRKRLANLSPRERELLAAVVSGKSTKMIADDLRISSRTVDHHRANLMEKMKAANVADLVRMAMEAGREAGN